MPSNVTDSTSGTTANRDASPTEKGKGKGKAASQPDTKMEEVEDDDEDDSGEEENSDDDDDSEEETYEEIDPTVIIGRRTRGKKIDYTSKEALAKAGLEGVKDVESSDEDVEMKG